MTFLGLRGNFQNKLDLKISNKFLIWVLLLNKADLYENKRRTRFFLNFAAIHILENSQNTYICVLQFCLF